MTKFAFPRGTLYRTDQQGGQGEERCLAGYGQRDCQRTGRIDIGTDAQSAPQKGKRGYIGSGANNGKDCPPCIPQCQIGFGPFPCSTVGRDAVQQLRIEYRWEAIEQENKEMELAGELGTTISPGYWRTVIAPNSCWPEAGTCCSSRILIGRQASGSGLRYCSITTPYWKKHTG